MGDFQLGRLIQIPRKRRSEKSGTLNPSEVVHAKVNKSLLIHNSAAAAAAASFDADKCFWDAGEDREDAEESALICNQMPRKFLTAQEALNYLWTLDDSDLDDIDNELDFVARKSPIELFELICLKLIELTVEE
ncbi:hypothetical protein AVEN_43097-1 [Araneus ventricosus]|uniref:Uncharacterized protein n=1 Tax=Araneus ventricosus TaxID=182803 RepID=A0A4Y2J875_ARAVE|nr:hypothetical protein AVEN_43097-1 [Araneus ventricosus]